MSIKITYAITVCNELEVTDLLDQLTIEIDFNSGEYELLIQFDSDKITDPILALISNYALVYDYCKVIGCQLNGDFATFKNNLTENASGEYIFQIDADELLPDGLINGNRLYTILSSNPNIGLFRIPRINIVVGITSDYIAEMGWKSNYRGFGVEEALCESSVNYPDFQGRIFKRDPKIKWYGKIHEQILGHEFESRFPETEDYSLLHIKSFEKQVSQNTLYSSLIK